MPTGSKDYSKGIIYKLCCSNPEITEIYIGSTLNFRGRKAQHKRTCNNINSKDFNYHVYQFIRDNGEWNNWDMIQIEEYACATKKELESRERYWIEFLRSTLNKNIPTRTRKEWTEKNKDKIIEQRKEYRITNKEKIAEKNKKYRTANKGKIAEKNKKFNETNKEKIAEKNKKFYETNKEKIAEKKKEYRESNKEKIAEKKKAYRQKNKDIIAEKQKETYICPCSEKPLTKCNKSVHEKTKKHINYINK